MVSVLLGGLFLPLIGTALGSLCVFFMKDNINKSIERGLLGFAGGVMIAASVWSLIIPSIDLSVSMGAFSFVPAALGFWFGMLFLLIPDSIMSRMREKTDNTGKKRISMLIFAVALHNLPEGMAIGVALSALIEGNSDITAASVMALATGIAIQNFPEGSIISMPLAANGQKKGKSFLYGFLSGVIEPIGCILTVIFAHFVTPALSYLLAFAAGAMVFAVIKEIIPQMDSSHDTDWGTVMFALGFTVMMALDVALG